MNLAPTDKNKVVPEELVQDEQGVTIENRIVTDEENNLTNTVTEDEAAINRLSRRKIEETKSPDNRT